MTIEELIRELEGLPQDTEVRFASQPSWPFEYSISDVVYTPLAESVLNEDDEEEEIGIVYLGEGRQIGYLPGVVKDELGW